MLLEVNNIEVIYNEVILVLKGMSLEVPESSIVTLLGSNGAGKSTTLKATSGLLKPENGETTRGTIAMSGQRIDGLSPEAIVRLGIVQVMEGRHIFEELTVEENLIAGSHVNRKAGQFRDDIEKVYEYFPVLKKLRKRVAGYMSGGEQQMLAIGRAFMTGPRLLLLDEPSLGLAPLVVEGLFEIIVRINQEEKCAILLVEQNANIALDIASYGYIMEKGQIVLEGPVDELKVHKNVKEFYLGIDETGTRKSFREIKHYKRKKRWFSS
ncbi:MAG: ABC transporter ATP-binding protein [Desulfatiglans sp.]|jgi:branched-chain amino acid transport system ATP-binding protein|nr:ABC transporter ATP-binding protein [Thermodesulfobacteriota bacterium]MEE4354201.1 ABC transporter ATP-binding protein [Desulfatiglans sp.]